METCTAKPEDMDVPDCSICLNPVTADTGQVKLACSHTFHLGCIGRWITRGDETCPMCRRAMSETERISDGSVSEVSFTEREILTQLEFLARYLNVTEHVAQMYLDSFNGDHNAVIHYIRYVRRGRDDPFYIPPLEHPHTVPVLPEFGYSDDEFLRKRHWMHYSRDNHYLVERGYLTE
jgi:hypothetical protein